MGGRRGRHGEAAGRAGAAAQPEQEAEEAPAGVRGGAPFLRQVSAGAGGLRAATRPGIRRAQRAGGPEREPRSPRPAFPFPFPFPAPGRSVPPGTAPGGRGGPRPPARDRLPRRSGPAEPRSARGGPGRRLLPLTPCLGS